jgi:hypothetical protein
MSTYFLLYAELDEHSDAKVFVFAVLRAAFDSSAHGKRRYDAECGT